MNFFRNYFLLMMILSMIIIPALTNSISVQASGEMKATQQVVKKETKKNTKSYKKEPWIEVRATPAIMLGEINAWHLYIVYHSSDDKIYYYRGGPTKSLSPVITTEWGEYKPGTIDYDPISPSTTVMKGKDAVNKMSCFQKELDNIKKKKIPYNVSSNSNSVVYTLLVNCDVPAEKPLRVDTPGWYTKLQTDKVVQTPEKSKDTKNKQKSNYVIYLLDEGNMRLNEGNYQEAIKNYEKALQSDPKDSSILNNLGVAYYKLGDYENAKKYFDKALELDPNNKNAQNYKKALLQEKAKTPENKQNNEVSDLIDKGNKLVKEGKYQEAIAFYERALKIKPKDATILTNLGWAYHKLGDYEKAKKYLEGNAPESDSNNKNAQDNKKTVQEKTTSPTNEQKNKEIKDLHDKAWALRDEGKYQEAIKIYEQILDIDHKNFSALWRLGASYLQLGDYENAREYYDDALDIDHKDTYVLTMLGYIYEKLGNYDKAMKYYNTAIVIDPNYKPAQDLKKALEQKLNSSSDPKKEEPNITTPVSPQTPARDLTGTWSGKWTAYAPYLDNCVWSFPLTLILAQDGNYVTGTYEATGIGTKISGGCLELHFGTIGAKGTIHFTTFATGYDGMLNGNLAIEGSFTTGQLDGRGKDFTFLVYK